MSSVKLEPSEDSSTTSDADTFPKDGSSEPRKSAFAPAEKDTAAVNRSKILVDVALLAAAAAAAVGTATYCLLSNEQTSKMRLEARKDLTTFAWISQHLASLPLTKLTK